MFNFKNFLNYLFFQKKKKKKKKKNDENDIDRAANITFPVKIENFQARSCTKENGADIENMGRATMKFSCELRHG